jgi:excisionase family DNA binding protein
MKEPEEPTMSVAQAAERLGISRQHCYDLIAEGTFPAKVIELGTRKRVVRASLEELLSAAQ